jgi:hypothetical protein
MAVETNGPMPGTVISFWQLFSRLLICPISCVTASIRASSRSQSS